MIHEAIILAGGVGSRLKAAVSDKPKCLAPVNGIPFLTYLLTYLQSQKIARFIFSLGYKHEMIEAFLKENFSHLDYELSIEAQALGTGGAIKMACKKVANENAFVCNGDTMFKIDAEKLADAHEELNSLCTIALKPMKNFDRYGNVEIDRQNAIIAFKEKKFCSAGIINGGVYALNAFAFAELELPEKFSFESDFLEKQITGLYGNVQDAFFIDIGIPEDYHRAQSEKELLEILKK